MEVSNDTRTAAGTLATFVAQLRYEDLPEAVVRAAVRALIDTLGAALGGVRSEEAGILYALAPQLGSGDASTVWGTRMRSTAPVAALINGTVAHSLELDDFGGCDHSGATVIPAVLSVAEAQNRVTGRDLITAIVAGYEMARRPMEAVGGYSAHNGHGWHSTGTCGSFGAAAGAGRMLGLDERALTSALGLAGSVTGGLWAFIDDGAMSKRYHAGRAAETGTTAALLASQGFTGPSRIFEAEWGGFLSTYAPGEGNIEALTGNLGEDFRILRSGIKPYASCRGVHSSIDALLQLRQDSAFGADDVVSIDVHLSPFDMGMVGGRQTHSLLAAQMSLPYGLAVVLQTGDASILQYSEDRRSDPEMNRLLNNIHLYPRETMSRDEEPIVEVHLRDSRVLQKRVDVALGDPKNPVGDAALDEKFANLAGMNLPQARVSELIRLLRHISDEEKLSALWCLLRQPEG